MSDVFTVLGADHAKVKEMVKEFQSLIGPANEPTERLAEQGGALADKLITAESQHEAAEEQYFWPAVREKVAGGQELAKTALEQETAAKKLLATLDGMAPTDGPFIGLITEFITAGEAHIAFEEDQVWPKLRAVLSAEEARELGEKVAAAEKAGPTRPHPMTPPNPAVLKTAGVAAAATDKVRDALSDRQN